MILEGWTANVQLMAPYYLEFADHTWVRSPSNGRFFDCWGGHSGPNQRMVTSGNGSYNRANCYRCPIWPFPDTAGIGIYAVDGVCHQSANCFLYTAGRTLNFDVRGYWFSVFSYGVYGRAFWRWLVAPYGTCSWTTAWSPHPMALSAGDGGGDDDEPAEEEDPVIGIVRDVYLPSFSRGREKHPHELLVEETKKVTQHFVPEVDYEKIRRIQLDYLQKRDDVIARGHKEDQLAKRLDDLARKVQKDLLKVLGTEHYEQLMGVKPDQQLGIVEPDLAGAAGVPVPPPEVQMQMSQEQPGSAVPEDAEGPESESENQE